MPTDPPIHAAEMILKRRWQELAQLQQQAAADECQMAEAVLRPQPAAFEIADGMLLTELLNFVPSAAGLAGEYEQAFQQFALMSFRWSVHNQMVAAQEPDPKLRDAHRQLIDRYAERAVALARELAQFHESMVKLGMSSKAVRPAVADQQPPLFVGQEVGVPSTLATCQVIVTLTSDSP